MEDIPLGLAIDCVKGVRDIRKAVLDMKIAIAIMVAVVLIFIYALCKSSGTRGE